MSQMSWWSLGVALLLVSTTTRPTVAQGTSSIKGSIVAVGDSGQRRPLEGARISLVGTDRSVTTDAKGAFVLADLEAGQYTIQASAIGYSSMTSPIRLKARETLEVEFEALAEAVVLPELTVKEQANYGPFDWIRRKAEGRGRYVTRQQLEERHHSTIPDALRMMAGVRIECRGNICVARMARAPRGCSPAFFMDGIPADPAAMWLTPVTDIEGIEVYSGPAETPPELESAQARCGVIVLWTRPPPPRRPKDKKPKVVVDTTLHAKPDSTYQRR